MTNKQSFPCKRESRFSGKQIPAYARMTREGKRDCHVAMLLAMTGYYWIPVETGMTREGRIRLLLPLYSGIAMTNTSQQQKPVFARRNEMTTRQTQDNKTASAAVQRYRNDKASCSLWRCFTLQTTRITFQHRPKK